jgi:hypothetical protein
VRTAAALVFIAVVCLSGACGGGDSAGHEPSPASPEGGLALAVHHLEPLRSGAPVAWTLEVRNDGPRPVTLTFGTGKRGDVMLRQGPTEPYRWSRERVFTQALGQETLGPREARSYPLPDRLDVPPGRYELVATLASDPAPPELTKTVTVEP